MQVAICSYMKKSIKALTFIYCILMFTFFLFYIENAYFNITVAKYRCFSTLTFVYTVLSIICGSVYLFFHSASQKKIKNFLKSLSVSDWSMLVLLMSNTITTLLSEDLQASLLGSWGRSAGLNFTVLLCVMYFLVSRTLSHMRVVLHVFLGSSFLVGLLGVWNALGYDPFHFFESVNEAEVHWFLSTVGNIAFFAHLFCLSLPLAVGLFLKEDQRYKSFGYAGWCWFGFTAIIISNIDGAYLGIAAFMAYYLWQSCTSRENLKKFLVICLIALGSFKLLAAITLFNDYLTFDGISEMLVHSSFVWILIGMVTILLLFMKYFPEKVESLPYYKIRTGLFISMASIVILLFLSIVYFTWIDTRSSLNGWENYLRFNNSWGHERGYLWKTLSSGFLNSYSFIEQLFGKGLDCTRLILASIIDHPATAIYYDHAHNEYLQYLVTSGIIGLFAYLSVLGSCLIRLIKKHRLPYASMFVAVLLAHGAQALTGLNQPITTPLLFLLLAIMENMIIDADKCSQTHKNENGKIDCHCLSEFKQ